MSITLEINCDKMDSKIYQAIIKIVLNWKIENDKKTRIRIPDGPIEIFELQIFFLLDF